jgi:hypothetical protein
MDKNWGGGRGTRNFGKKELKIKSVVFFVTNFVWGSLKKILNSIYPFLI